MVACLLASANVDLVTKRFDDWRYGLESRHAISAIVVAIKRLFLPFLCAANAVRVVLIREEWVPAAKFRGQDYGWAFK